MKAIVATRLFTGEAMHEDAALLIESGRVRAVCPRAEIPAGVERERLPSDLILAPGFIDVQVNGGGGLLFNDAPDLASLRIIARAHRRFGTTALLATLITDTEAAMRRAADAVRAAQSVGEPGILGLHLEGPFLNPARKGVHAEALIRVMTEADPRFLCDETPRPLLVTLAPERVGAAAIARLAAAGVIVAIGHSDALCETALGSGARGYTHLFNAMPPIAGREPGPAGAAMESDAFASIIADGHHVHPANLRLAFRAKGAERLMLVTDAMASVGSDATEFILQGRMVRLADGQLRTEDGVLAGAHLDMAGAVRNAVALMGACLADALRMATATPADFLRLADRGRLRPGAVADAVAITGDVDVEAVWLAGERCGP